MLLPESWKFLLVEFGIYGFRVQNIAQGIWNPESMTWNPESKTVLNSLKWGVTTDLTTQ